MPTPSDILIKSGLFLTGIASGILIFISIQEIYGGGGGEPKLRKKSVRYSNDQEPDNQRPESFDNQRPGVGIYNRLQRPRAAGVSRPGASPIATEPQAAAEDSLLHDEDMIPTEIIQRASILNNQEVWASDESESLLSLIMAIAHEQTLADTIIHRSVSCNHCGVSPVRGWRFKCANCVDFDLCAGCEALDVHYKTHVFIKIRIPIPPQSNPRTMTFAPFYPGVPWTTTPRFDTTELEQETHFDSMEIMGFYDQFKSLSTIDTPDGGITKATFEKCLGTLKKDSQMIVDRLFCFFDDNNDGIISFESMVRGLSVLCKGTQEERIKYAFQGYDLNNDGLVSRDELRKMFKSYFLLSMELVRGVVKVMEEGMLDNFDDEAENPVSAAFGAPSTQQGDGPSNNVGPGPSQDKKEDRDAFELLQMTDSIVLGHATTSDRPPLLQTDFQSPSVSSSSRTQRDQRRPSWDSPVSSIPFNTDEDHMIPIMESISQDAIEEMVQQVFTLAGAQERNDITIDEFKMVVEQDPNILAWIEALGSVF